MTHHVCGSILLLASCLPILDEAGDSSTTSLGSNSHSSTSSVSNPGIATTTEDPDKSEGSLEPTSEDSVGIDPTTGGSTSGTSGTSGSSGEASSDSSGESTGPNIPEGARLVFVSSDVKPSDLGPLGYDNFCMTSAWNANLTGSFKALLMDTEGFWPEPSEFPYVLRSGKMVVEPMGIWKTIVTPLDEDENGKAVPHGTAVWTGFNMDILDYTCACDQNKIEDPNYMCSPWSTQDGEYGWIGRVGGEGKEWYYAEDGEVSCSAVARIYCFEVES